ncbi:MAG: DUF3108 domain-containing protein [Acidobacteria bacterium]|nr:DUF3108 domain-containing protein [Acidobacteriota bacterium]MBV9475296.1 DUF3108 domain-containing protein [Acidobacteriota bacterium]
MNLILAVALLFAASVPATTPVEQAFARGETLDYNLSWLKITGGTGRLTIGPSGEDSYRITSVAHSTPGFSRIFRVRDEIESTVARKDFSTLRYVKRLDEKDDKIEEVTTVDDGVATRTRRKVKKTRVPRPVFDPMSVMFYLRLVDLSPGKSYALTLIADGKVYDVQARVVRRETIDTPAGTFATVVVEPRMTSDGVEREEKLFIWYSDDERRIPVRIRTDVKFGSIIASLRGVQAGVTSVEPPPLKR